MANDRLYLCCPECPDGFMLAKRYGDAWSTRNHSDRTFDEQLDAFFEKHWRCRAGEVDDPYKFLLLNEKEAMDHAEVLREKA